MRNLFILGAIIFGVSVLSGCSGSSNSSSPTTSASGGICTYNGVSYVNSANGAACNCVNNGTGTLTDSISGAICSNSTGTGIGTGIGGCTLSASGIYINPLTGQACNTGTNSCVLTPQGYYISTTTGQICSSYGSGGIPGGYTGGCNYWSQIYYPVQYAPAYLNGQLVCVEVL